MLAHGGTPDEQVAMVTVVAGLWIGWAGLSRIRDKGFPRLPLGGAYGLAVVGAIVVIAGLTLPRQFLRPTATPSGARPASTATLAIDRPTAGQVVSGTQVEVVMTLDGGRIVDSASTTLTPDTGHIHLSLDGTLVSMTYGLVQLMDVQGLSPGEHTIEAEYVAADHGPFDPRVVARITFTIGGGA
ncbi:MAG: hypothetical protein ACXWEG_10665 [Actinomycetota bacterium]